MQNSRKVVLYIAASLDGFIAGPDDNLDFLSRVEKEGEDYGYAGFINTVDTVIMGRKTYDWVIKHIGFQHKEKDVYIITRTPRPVTGNIKFYTGDIRKLVEELKEQPGNTIFVDGGAETIHELLKDNLIDELYLSIIPVLLGNGVRLFRDNRPEQLLTLINVSRFDTGLAQLHYKLNL